MSLHSKGIKCPRCGSKDVQMEEEYGQSIRVYTCMDCDHVFESGRKKVRHRDKPEHPREKSNREEYM